MSKQDNQSPPLPRSGEKLFSVVEFGEMIKQGKTAAWRLIHSGQVACYRFGGAKKRGRVFVPQSAVEEYLAKCYSPAHAPASHSPGKSAIEKTAKRKNSEVA